jgi:hypothetical protein
MHDRPTSSELVAAARLFLETELLPSLTDQRLRFQALVAAHVLGVVERELPVEEADLVWESAWLAKILGESHMTPNSVAELRQQVREGNRRVCASIRNGDFDAEPAYRQLGAQLREVVARKLRVANPKANIFSAAKTS